MTAAAAVPRYHGRRPGYVMRVTWGAHATIETVPAPPLCVDVAWRGR